VVVSERTPGYGAAYKAGMKAATGDVIVTLNGDGTYPAESIPMLRGQARREALGLPVRVPLPARRQGGDGPDQSESATGCSP
jgi:glycosyltransferase involved in cell wall biosynthesis